jgi:hypothetical protein
MKAGQRGLDNDTSLITTPQIQRQCHRFHNNDADRGMRAGSFLLRYTDTSPTTVPQIQRQRHRSDDDDADRGMWAGSFVDQREETRVQGRML